MSVLAALARFRRVGARTAAVGAAGALVLAAGPAYASPAEAPSYTDKVDCVVFSNGTCTVAGVVYAVAQIGGTTYIGGSFAKVAGQPRANLAAIGADGKVVTSWTPATDGIVYALAASDDGSKVYVGGEFSTVNGVARRGLVAVDPTQGALVSEVSADLDKDGAVRALVTGVGNRLYVGGKFETIGGKWNGRLASVDQTTGVVDKNFRPRPNTGVRALALDEDKSKLYVGGSFSAMSSLPRPGIGEVDAVTGVVTGFAPAEGGVVIATDVDPSGRLFFSTTNNRVWAYDTGTDNAPEYRVRTSGDVQAIYAADDEVYVGGHFSKFPETGEARLHMGSFRPGDGSVTAWNPNINGSYGPWAVAPVEDAAGNDVALVVGGDFTRVNYTARRGIARFNF